MSYTKGYKAFDKLPDGRMACRGFVFEVGKEYEVAGDLELCGNGFHFCKDIVLTIEYYPDIENNVYAEVEAVGDVVYEEPNKRKAATNKIKIGRIVDIKDFFKDGNGNSGNQNSGYQNSGNGNSGNGNSGNGNSGSWNSGSWNSGDGNSGSWNSGNGNSGSWNSGNWNSGNWNSGDGNSGNWNSGDGNSGHFNSQAPEFITVFNKPLKISEWEKAEVPSILCFNLLAGKTYKESAQGAMKNMSKEDINAIKALPNFDDDVFFEIFGVKLP